VAGLEGVEQRAKGVSGVVTESRHDGVEAILKSVADTLGAGLFRTHDIRPTQGSGGDARSVKPANAAPAGGGMGR